MLMSAFNRQLKLLENTNFSSALCSVDYTREKFASAYNRVGL